MQYRYWSKGAQMDADLAAMTARARAKRPDMFASNTIRESTMDDEGKVDVTIRKDVKAVAMPPSKRHALAHARG